ncbi:MAG TPA: GWxTD domain-containing protein [Thermoanaerobaculia bacterium]|nr:GWxTD domain-containing protein [Thermoanaerobaculia bacterium]
MHEPGWGKRWGRIAVPVVFLLLTLAASKPVQYEDWASSPEAYFLTAEERAEWKALDSNISRDLFKERYWLKRDPSPGSDKNEFKDLVLGRIKIADSRFRIQNVPGSQTARGMVFIVLGSPARVTDENAPHLVSDAGGRRLGVGVTPVAVIEGNETTSTWYYETDRTPRILEVLGRPSLEIKIVVEPSRRMDAIQDPGLFNEIRETIARKSIVNPDLVPSATAARVAEAVFAAEAPALPRATLSAAVRAALDEAPASPRGNGSFAGAATVFHETGPAETVLWIFAAPAKNASLHCLVRSEDGREVAAKSEPAVASSLFSAQSKGVPSIQKVPLPAGVYTAALALTDATGKVLASSKVPVHVPAVEGKFAVSSLILSRGPAAASKGTDSTFTFGSTYLPPRADAVFQASQSLWYFVEVANPSDPSKVMLEARLRRAGQPIAALPPFPARLEPFAAGRFLAGIELPLQSLGAGEYVLYLAVRDGESDSATQFLRRADFQVVP